MAMKRIRGKGLLLFYATQNAKKGLAPFARWYASLHESDRAVLRDSFGIDVYGNARHARFMRKEE